MTATAPTTMVAELFIGENAGATAINILAPTDPVYSASQLSVKVTGLPTDGTVYLSDGVTAVTNGQTLTVNQLTGLLFTPTTGVVSQTSTFSYTVTNPAAATATGSATLVVGSAPTGSDTLVVTVAATGFSPQFFIYENDAANSVGSGVKIGGLNTVTTTGTVANYAPTQYESITFTGSFSTATNIDLDYISAAPPSYNYSVLRSIEINGTTYLAQDGEFAHVFTSATAKAASFTPGYTQENLYQGTLRFLVNDAVTTTPASLSVTAGSTPTAIGIVAPVDPNYPSPKVEVTVTSLPTDGSVYLADGVTPVLPGEPLTVSQLTGLTFVGNFNAAGQSSNLNYTVSDLTGGSASGSATLSVTANTNGPVTTATSLSVAGNATPTSIGIVAPTDPNFTSTNLTATALALPTNGTLFLADGVTAVTPAEPLTIAQLTGLKFAPTTGVTAESSLFTYTVKDPSGKSSLGTATLNINPTGTILTVGPGKQFATISAAIAAASNGATIQVSAGTYTNDFPTQITHSITLEGIGGMVNMVATVELPSDKGILIVGDGTNSINVTINNFSFSGAFADQADANGAGVRYQSGNLTLNNDVFYNNQNGLLGGAFAGGTITVNNSEFLENGVNDPNLTAGFGFTHNIYIGDIAQATISGSYFHEVSGQGHEIKSRAQSTTIQNSRIQDESLGTGSFDIDLPNGGNALITGNVIEKGPLSQTRNMISIGEEGVSNTTTSLQITGNTFLNDFNTSSILGVSNATTATAQITGNSFFHLTAAQIASGPNSQSTNTFLATEPALVTTSPWSAAAVSAVPCFCRGTMILTENGEMPVECLKIGDRVMTIADQAKPITWIGSGWRSLTWSNPEARPLIVRADAIADGVPLRDLHLTRGHSLYLDGVLVPVEFLVNGRSIVWDDAATEVSFYHLELEDHDVLLAEGAPAESYRDDGNRKLFDNPDPPRFASPDMAHVAPVLTGGPRVDRIWRKLLARSGFLEPEATNDPDLHLVADWQRIDPYVVDCRAHEYQGTYRFRLDRAPRQLTIASRIGVPLQMGINRDPRRLGVALRSIGLRGGDAWVELDYDSPLLTEGFNEPESEPRHRWTNGLAVVPRAANRLFKGEFEVVLDVVCTTKYAQGETVSQAGIWPVPAMGLAREAAPPR